MYIYIYMIHKGKNRSTLSGLVFVFVVVFSEKDTPNKSNKTRALLRELFRLELSTAEYTPLCKVEGHCFNGCGISPDNEIFCREVWLSVAVLDRKGGMKSAFLGS